MLTTPPENARQQGFAIVSAIFIIVALAALGVYITVVSSTQHLGSTLDLEGARAYQAARSGSEWGAAQVVLVAGASCFPDKNLGAVNGVAVTVRCEAGPAGPAGEIGLGALFTIRAWACNRPGADGACPGAAGAANYVERYMTILVERPPPP